MARLFAILRTLVVAPLFVALWLWWLPRWLGGNGVFADPRPLGWIVVVIGAAIALPCFWAFAWRGFGTPAPWDAPRKLVISGPYRFVRNPMYVGMGIAMIGFAIVFPRLTRIMLGELLVFVIAVSIFVMAYEEPALRRAFGDDYADYCRNVRRWIPRFRPFDKRATVP